MHAVVNGKLIPFKEAFLHISDLSIHRGYGVFDFFKIKGGHPYFLNDYLDRFYSSAEILKLKVPQKRDDLISSIYKLIEKNSIQDSGMKIILTGGYSQDGYQPLNPNLILSHHGLLLPTSTQIEQGISIITHEYVRDLPRAKSINYTMGIYLIERVKQEGASDVLYHQNGIVSEFPRSNFFIVKNDNTIVTASQNVLHGITRKNVLSLARRFYKAEEGVVTLQDVKDAKEAFLTSTTKRIMPVVKVDGTPIGNGKPGAVSRNLLNKLIEMEKEDEKLNARPRKFYGF